jgi:hypothetical protein
MNGWTWTRRCRATRACKTEKGERENQPDGVKSTNHSNKKHTWDVCTMLTAPHVSTSRRQITYVAIINKLKSNKKKLGNHAMSSIRSWDCL